MNVARYKVPGIGKDRRPSRRDAILFSPSGRARECQSHLHHELTPLLPVLRSICQEIVPEFGDKTLRGPGAGFTKSADGSPGDIIWYRLQCVGIAVGACAIEQTGSNFL